MKRTVIDCDACDKTNLKAFHSLSFVVGTQIDSPSGRTEMVEETLEFCAECLGKIAQSAISTRPRDEQKAMYQRFADQKGNAPAPGYGPKVPGSWAPAGVVFRDAKETVEREERRQVMVERSGVVPPKR